MLNDGSTDGSERIVKEYDDPRIRYYSNGKNLGIPVSHNKLMDYARGEYLALVDSDNLCCPDRLEKQVKYLDEHPDVTIVGSWESCSTICRQSRFSPKSKSLSSTWAGSGASRRS